MTGETVKIELDNEEAKLFVEFRKHQELFNILLQSGVLSFKTTGQAVLNFGNKGVLGDIKLSTVPYRNTNSQS